MQINGLKGQHINDERCWIIKSHHPKQQPKVLSFKSDKVLCVVRNPLDVFVSYATLCNTLSHSAELDFRFDKEYPVWWDWWVKLNVDLMCKYFDILFKDCVENRLNPIHVVRFEDLCDEPINEITSMMKFSLGMDNLEGTNMERRINAIRDMGTKATETYRLKAHSKQRKFNTKKDMYTPEQHQYIKDKLAKWIWYFGYANHEGNERTGFFDYENPAPELVASFRGFRAQN